MDYPRDYTLRNNRIKFNEVFVAMPINNEFDDTLAIITTVCLQLGMKLTRADDIATSNFIISNILEGIATSELIIADISGCNSNVLYEVGIAHSLRPRQSILLITQDDNIPTDSPFDVRHWSILQYNLNNEAEFKRNLRKRISEARSCVDRDLFIEQLLSSHTFNISLITEFISECKKFNDGHFTLLSQILSGSTTINDCNRDNILAINEYLTNLGDFGDSKFIKITFTLKKLLFTSDFILSQYADTIKNIFFNTWCREGIEMGDSDYWELIANICFKMIEEKHTDKNEAILWLTNYLKNTRMGRIDKVRTNIEDFLLTINDEHVDLAIVNLLKSDSRTAKESAADICGQKPIFRAVDNLITIIKSNESDPHIVRSCINAFARMRVNSAAPYILEWMKQNRDKWGTQAVSSSLMSVATKALDKLNKEDCSKLKNLNME